MIHTFESLPGWIIQGLQAVASWAGHNPMTFVLVALFSIGAGWFLLLFITLHIDRRRIANAIERKSADRRLPGTFPGDRN